LIEYFSSVGLGLTLLPGVFWAKVQHEPSRWVTAAVLKGALTSGGLDLCEEDQ
jgi:hypothetical protein